jgi:hypothetical protein
MSTDKEKSLVMLITGYKDRLTVEDPKYTSPR